MYQLTINRGMDGMSTWLPKTYTVGQVEKLTEDTASFTLSPDDGSEVMFEPGQFNMIYVFGIGEIPISISGGDEGNFHHTVRDIGLTSKALVNLKPGMKVGIRGPYGSAWPLKACDGGDVIVVAGGIGLAPLRPVVQHLENHKSKFNKRILLIGARSPENLIFHEDIERWKKAGIEVHISVDTATPNWDGTVGVITKLFNEIDFDADKAKAIMCGPEIMMRFCASEFEARGLSRKNIYISMERNMKCAVGLCGHCQFGADFICKDGPVFAYERVGKLMTVKEI
jgi:NAD(P)H-flavin reductase